MSAGDDPRAHDRPLRVALMVEDFPVISETFVINMATGLLQRGHDVTILQMSGQKAPAESMHASVGGSGLGERTIAPTMGRLLIGGFRRDIEGEEPGAWGPIRRIAAFGAQAASLVRLPRFDVVHCQFAHLGVAAMRHRALRTLRADRLVVHVRGQDVTSYVRTHGEGVFREMFAATDLVVANSRHFRDRALQLGASPERTTIIGSAVDCAKFVPTQTDDPPTHDSTESSRPSPGPSHIRERVALVTVGRLVPKKGLVPAIEAVALASQQIPLSLDVIGEGPQRGELEALVERRGLGDVVRLSGALPHEAIVERFARSDLLLAPSVTPVSGDQDAPVNSLKEAMAMELPVIGTRHGGIPELVEPGTNGYLVDEHDVDGLAATIVRAVAERDRWGELGAAGRRRILAEFDLPVVSDRLVDAYRSLFGGGDGAARIPSSR